MKAASASDPGHSVLRTSAVIAGAPLAAFLVGCALAAFLPVSEPMAFAVGVHSVVPLWVGLSCALGLFESGRRAWLFCLAVALPLGLALAVR